jgi:hypothetical protein
VVTLEIPAASLGFWSPSQRKDVLESGTFDLWVGDKSVDGVKATFELK